MEIFKLNKQNVEVLPLGESFKVPTGCDVIVRKLDESVQEYCIRICPCLSYRRDNGFPKT